MTDMISRIIKRIREYSKDGIFHCAIFDASKISFSFHTRTHRTQQSWLIRTNTYNELDIDDNGDSDIHGKM